MGTSFSRIALTLSLAGSFSAVLLQGQTAQVRANVSSALPHYIPTVQLKAPVEVVGTDALSDLGDEWAHVFKNFQPDAKFVFVPGYTRDAVKGLVDGTRPLIICGRELTPEEMKGFQAKFGYMPMRIPICMDATIVFVNKSNPISSITMAQLDAIYSKDRLGGAKEPAAMWGDLKVRGDLSKRGINAYAREEGTATRDAFKTTVLLKGDYRPGIEAKNDASALAEAILTDEAGIAFGSLSSWYATLKILPVIPYNGSDARLPTQENVTSSKYPMPRLYYAYVNRIPGKPLDPGVNEALHFLLSQEGQNAAADSGILPAPVEFLMIALKRLDR